MFGHKAQAEAVVITREKLAGEQDRELYPGGQDVQDY